jgi:hypothetical protein
MIFTMPTKDHIIKTITQHDCSCLSPPSQQHYLRLHNLSVTYILLPNPLPTFKELVLRTNSKVPPYKIVTKIQKLDLLVFLQQIFDSTSIL